MTKTISSHDQCVEEDYIDIDPDFMSTSINASSSQRNSKEFEFILCPNPQERCSYNSLADELFYKGTLLPLHLHPRIQTIQRLLSCERNPHHSAQGKEELENESLSNRYYENEEYGYSIKPAQCGTKSSWSKKFKGLGSSSLCSKLKASSTYLKSLFVKPTCSNDWCNTSRLKDCADDGGKRSLTNNIIGKDSSSLKSSIKRETLMEEDELAHRKSFSNAAKSRATTRSNSLYSNSSSSSSYSSSSSPFPSLNLNELYISLSQPTALRRSNSANSEMESSIHGAITYCKKSQDLVSGRKSDSSIGCSPFDF